MQLFIIPKPFDIHHVSIEDKQFIHQITRVLRMKLKDQCMLQWQEGLFVSRWCYEIAELWKKQILLKQLSDTEVRRESWEYILAVALPNKRSKAELIAQKLAEVGITTLLWFPAQRSQHHKIPPKKLERMHDIAREAIEQSWGWRSMKILMIWSLKQTLEYYQWATIRLCDILTEGYNTNYQKSDNEKQIITYIWPEWWRWPQDYATFNEYEYQYVDLWKRILRMETAAIIAWRKSVYWK